MKYRLVRNLRVRHGRLGLAIHQLESAERALTGVGEYEAATQLELMVTDLSGQWLAEKSLVDRAELDAASVERELELVGRESPCLGNEKWRVEIGK